MSFSRQWHLGTRVITSEALNDSCITTEFTELKVFCFLMRWRSVPYARLSWS